MHVPIRIVVDILFKFYSLFFLLWFRKNKCKSRLNPEGGKFYGKYWKYIM